MAKSRKASKSRRKAPCPEGKVRSRETGRCRMKKSASRKASRKASKSRRRKAKAPCPEGKVRDRSTHRCRMKKSKGSRAAKSRKAPKAPCPEGKVRDRSTHRCRMKKSKGRSPVASLVRPPRAVRPAIPQGLQERRKSRKAKAPCPEGKVRDRSTHRCLNEEIQGKEVPSQVS